MTSPDGRSSTGENLAVLCLVIILVGGLAILAVHRPGLFAVGVGWCIWLCVRHAPANR